MLIDSVYPERADRVERFTRRRTSCRECGRINPGLMRICAATALLLLIIVPAPVFAQAPVAYRLTFPEPEHRWMQVEVSFPDLSSNPLELHMSRASPGRYAL